MAEKKEQKVRYEVTEVPTQMGLAFRDNESNETLTDAILLARLASDISEIKKHLTG